LFLRTLCKPSRPRQRWCCGAKATFQKLCKIVHLLALLFYSYSWQYGRMIACHENTKQDFLNEENLY
ncbi:hypothetical protein N1Z44_005521, partial [Klebsiella pneumoniae]